MFESSSPNRFSFLNRSVIIDCCDTEKANEKEAVSPFNTNDVNIKSLIENQENILDDSNELLNVS